MAWFPLTSLLLGLNIALLLNTREPKQIIKQPRTSNFATILEAAESLEQPVGTGRVLGTSITAEDARPIIIGKFLRKHGSPITPYSGILVSEADAHDLDYRLVVAISMCESNAGKRMPSNDSHNAWGIAVYTGQQSGATFKDWPSAIRWVSNFLKERFFDRGITDLKKVGAIWAPPSVEKGYSWTNCVENFLSEIEEL